MVSGDVEVLLDYRREDERGNVVRVRALSVPDSEKFPNGVKYRFHYGTSAGDTIVRYDNSYGVHERHAGDETEEIAFPDGGLRALYRRFVDDVNAMSASDADTDQQ